MKKKLSLILAFVMAFTLTAPALAVETEEEIIPREWLRTTSEVAAPEGTQDSGIPREWLREMPVADDYDYAAETLAKFYAEFPNEAAAFDADAYFAENYWYYDSKEEYLTSWGVDEAGFVQSMMLSYYEQLASDRMAAEALDFEKAELGGTPGEYGVMVNGTYLTYEAAQPIAESGRIYAPINETMNQLGVELPDGVEKYVRDGETYVPIRALADALGYDVFWDSLFETAVLIDKAAIIAAIDERLTIVNSTLGNVYAQSKDMEATDGSMSMDVTLTQFSTLNGDKDYNLSIHADVQATQTAIAMQMTLDLTDMFDLLAPLVSGMSPEALLSLAPLMPYLDELEISLIWNLEDGMLYVSAPILSALLPDVAEGDWISVETGMTMESLGVDLADVASMNTVGAILYYVITQQYAAYPPEYLRWYTGMSMVHLHTALAAAADTTVAWLGDDNFVEIDGGHRLSVPADAVTDVLMALMGYYADDLQMKEWTLNLDMLEDSIVGEFVLRPDLSGMYASLLPSYASLLGANPDFRIAAKMSADAFDSSFTLEFHMNNSMRVNVTMKAEQAEAAVADVLTAPPAGAKVLSWMEIDWSAISLF